MKKLDSGTAKIKTIRASSYLQTDGQSFRPEMVDDSHVYEDCGERPIAKRCRRGYWLLPSGKLGDITLELQAQQQVRAVKLLNTRNGDARDRTTKSVVIELRRNGDLVFETKSDVRRYPYWTEIPIPEVGPVDWVTIRITAFEGRGAGLNEVKIDVEPRDKTQK